MARPAVNAVAVTNAMMTVSCMEVRMLPNNEFIDDQALIPLLLPEWRIPCVMTDGDFWEFLARA
jgi:hypothetical protein